VKARESLGIQPMLATSMPYHYFEYKTFINQ
jgi:hypothetical protein